MSNQHSVSWVFIPVALIYLGLMFYVGHRGYRAMREKRTVRNFLTMGGAAGSVTMAIAYLSTQFSISTFMGAPAAATQIGWSFSAVLTNLGLAIAVPALLVGGRLMKLGPRLQLYTMPDYLGHRYYSHWPRALGALAILVFLIPTMGAQLLGAGLIWEIATGEAAWIGTVVAGIVVTTYCWAGASDPRC